MGLGVPRAGLEVSAKTIGPPWFILRTHGSDSCHTTLKYTRTPSLDDTDHRHCCVAGEAEDAEENQGLLGQFIDYIKSRKTVPLEQLATEFKLRTTDVIDRINGLEAMGRLTGVMDERGKVGFRWAVVAGLLWPAFSAVSTWTWSAQ